MSRRGDQAEMSTDIAPQMDELSLTQALLDFEIANARVIDLTQRLIEANDTVAELQAQVDDLRSQIETLQGVHDQMKGSHAFRIASRIWAVRNAVRG
jgi:predicted  nucleic acid-binding Zn-ribbon protein